MVKLSYSHLSAYKSCPRRYEFAFVKKLGQSLDPFTTFGVSVHSALAKWGKEEVAAGTLQVASDQIEMFENVIESSSELSLNRIQDLWRESFIIDAYESTMAADFDRVRGERLMEKFFEWWKKEERKVVGVETSFRMSLDTRHVISRVNLPEANRIEGPSNGVTRDDIIVSGRFDRVEEKPDGTLRVIDYKTGSVRSQEEVDVDLQLSIYAMAAKQEWGKEVSELVMLFLVDEELSEVITSRSEGELKTAQKTIVLFAERIASNEFRPTPSARTCKCCPYRRVCDVSAV